MSAVPELCPQCGLCCNGVLFGDVELQRGDDGKKLATLGVELLLKGRKKAFSQPCACFDGSLCTIYTDRPKRCRSFECRQVKQVDAGKVSLAAAQRKIQEARRRADEVLRLVRECGDANEAMPLNKRYASVMAQPMDLAGDDAFIERRSELMLAVGRLVDVLERDFLPVKDL